MTQKDRSMKTSIAETIEPIIVQSKLQCGNSVLPVCAVLAITAPPAAAATDKITSSTALDPADPEPADFRCCPVWM